MGIKGLLPFVAEACHSGNISEFEGQHVAIDVSCLLHRGVFGCVEAIAHGKKTNFCINFILKYLRIFFYYKCKVTLVFDGNPLPAKKDINDARSEKRQINKELGKQLIKDGKNKEAYKVFRQGVGVPKEITTEAIKYFEAMKGVDVVVAPYEADAQLAYLIQNKFVDAVVTQDSDLIVFGCNKIIFKLDVEGACTIFEAAKLSRCFSRPLRDNFNFTVFRRICLLAGCDYLDGGLPGVGLKRGELFFSKTSITDPTKFLPRVPGFLNMKSTIISSKFVQEFINAENTFLHQIVYDPKLKVELPLLPYPGTTKIDFVKITEQTLKLSEQYWYAGTLSVVEVLPTPIVEKPLIQSKIEASFKPSLTQQMPVKRPSQYGDDIIFLEERPSKARRTADDILFASRPPKTIVSYFTGLL